MPELTIAPQNAVWPPPNFADPRVTPYHVAKVGPLGESFLDICKRFDIKFDDLIEFNFGLKRSEPHFFEKINWYLKNKLGCTKTTAGGNFIFSGGEKIYIPQHGVTFDPVTVTLPAVRTADYTNIEGNASIIPVNDFRTKIQRCVHLLDSKAPQYSRWFKQYNLKIRASQRSGANFSDDAIDIAPLTFNASDTWLASVIIHESIHFWQYRDGHYEAGRVAELEANRFQLMVLRLIDGPQEEIDHMMRQDGGHADLNGDGVYDWRDYQQRAY